MGYIRVVGSSTSQTTKPIPAPSVEPPAPKPKRRKPSADFFPLRIGRISDIGKY